ALYPKPVELGRLPHDRSAVIEASAGTGKTFLLEHLVLDRVIGADGGTGDEVRIENILVVTFTDKGAAELSRRLRGAIDRLLAVAAGAAPPPAGDGGPPDHCWRLDATAVARLQRARQSFDRATIATMHGFCQRVLTENPFASLRLFSQRHVDSRQVFGQVFRDVLRRRLAVDDDLRPYLTAWMACGYTVAGLETLLYDARRFAATSPWAATFDPVRIASAVRDFLGVMADSAAVSALRAQIRNASTAKAITGRMEIAAEICRRFIASGDLPALLTEFEDADDLSTFVEPRLGPGPLPGDAERLRRAFFDLADAVVPIGVAVAQLFGPIVNVALDTHKRQSGVFDFDDMLALVAESLDGPHGDELVRALRARYRCALIDEFQDTDPIQWRIFRRIFLAADSTSPLVIVGDPKQAIYGFRGADVQTYLIARRAVSGDGGPAVHLERNFRSTAPLIDAYNAILDHQADDPFFDAKGDIHYDRPVSAGLAPHVPAQPPAPRPAVTLLSVTPTQPGDMRARDVRRSLAARIAAEIRALLAPPTAVPAGEIFVLTRMLAEGEAVGAALREAGVPFTFFKQDGLYQTPEARHIQDLLSAVDDPGDRSKRLRAWLTPFFALSLSDLPDCATVGADHPLVARLESWKALADEHRFESLFHRILDESGVIRRELFAGAGERRLTNYLHIFDLLLAQTVKGRRALPDLLTQLGGFIDSAHKPDPEDGNVQRRESDRDAVQIMTMHKAKGLEAEVVFLYGGFTAWRGGTRKVRTFGAGGQRVATYGRPRRLVIEERLKAEQTQEDQRLLYVALTRAKSRLYLPYFGNLPPGDELLEMTAGPEAEEWKKLMGGYRHVNRRLRALVSDPVFRDPRRELFAAREVPCPPAVDEEAAQSTRRQRLQALGAWQPPAALLADQTAGRAHALDELRRRRGGFVITSYSRLKQAHGGYQAPEDPLDDGLVGEAGAADLEGDATAAATVAPGADQPLPGGALTGIFLHAVLEALPLDSLAGRPPLADWAALPAVSQVFARAASRFDRKPEHLAEAQRLVHAALTTPIALPGGRTLDGVASAGRILREVEFVYPAVGAATGAASSPTAPASAATDAGDAGFVKGFIDFVVEVDGRAYLGDWKSDRLPAWTSDAVSAHVAANYGLQARLYAVALVKMLGIASGADYEARFGGMIFVFLRGLPDAVHVWRPSFADVARWRDDLGATIAAAFSPREANT
ncbi:MAG TPA: UvrD-helicase domain-containing protein, partial [Polyangia bacterium]|nr:UvrD-helicase domain-containing protein [Polyangia bacterium]